MKTTATCLRVLILGAPQVGKSALTVRFLTKRFIGEYSSGTECTYQTMFRYEDAALKVEIVDSTSNSATSNKTKDLDADAIVIVYSITDRKSLKQAQDLLEVVTDRAPFNTPVLLLGNKTDLHHRRQVSRDDVTLMTHQYQCRHCEVSVAESYTAVDRPMQELLTEGLLNRRLRLGQVKRRKSIFENVSRRIGNVFRRKSLEELLPKRRLPRVTATANRRSV